MVREFFGDSAVNAGLFFVIVSAVILTIFTFKYFQRDQIRFRSIDWFAAFILGGYVFFSFTYVLNIIWHHI